MAKIPGGITSKPSGKLGNIIFGAARTPQGKVATAREAVDPSNPNTSAQQAQRGKFAQAVSIVQDIGPEIYQGDWNRAVGQLPGFQSWQSILLNNLADDGTLSAPPTRPLGKLHFPDTWDAQPGDNAGYIKVSWSDETGDNGTDQDKQIVVAIEQEKPSSGDREVKTVVPPGGRTEGRTNVVDLKPDTSYLVCLYFRGKQSAEGLLSSARFAVATSTA